MTDPHTALTALITEHSGLTGARAGRLADKIAAEWPPAQGVVDLPTGAGLIAAERKRQVEAEGWSEEHDREHGSGVLYRAAFAYESGLHTYWPWDREWWKLKSALRNLVRAGALYQAAADVAHSDATLDPAYYASRRDHVAEQIDVLLAEILASGVVADAADVRRQTADDIAAAIEDAAEDSTAYAWLEAARLAREVGGDHD